MRRKNKRVVEREREINNHNAESFYKVVAYFISDNKTFKAELSEKLKEESDGEIIDKKNEIIYLQEVQMYVAENRVVETKENAMNNSAFWILHIPMFRNV